MFLFFIRYFDLFLPNSNCNENNMSFYELILKLNAVHDLVKYIIINLYVYMCLKKLIIIFKSKFHSYTIF
jgi:hypothetical protein